MRARDHGQSLYRVVVLGEIGRIVGRCAEAAEIDRIRKRAAIDRQRIRGTVSQRIDLGRRSRDIGRRAAGDLVGDQRAGAAGRTLGNGEGAGEHRGIVVIARQHRDVVVGGHVGAASDVGGDVGAHQVGGNRARKANLRRDGDADRHRRDRPGRIRADTDVAARADFSSGYAGAHIVGDIAVDDRQSRRRPLRRSSADGSRAGDLGAIGCGHRETRGGNR